MCKRAVLMLSINSAHDIFNFVYFVQKHYKSVTNGRTGCRTHYGRTYYLSFRDAWVHVKTRLNRFRKFDIVVMLLTFMCPAISGHRLRIHPRPLHLASKSRSTIKLSYIIITSLLSDLKYRIFISLYYNFITFSLGPQLKSSRRGACRDASIMRLI